MKGFLVVWMVLLFGVGAMPGHATPAPEAENTGRTVVVGVNHAPPYRVLEGEEPGGLYIEIFRLVAERMGWSPEFRETPFRRVLQMAEEGEVDILLGPQQTEFRSRSLAFVAPVFPPEPKLFFHVRPENEVARYEDLKGKRIGVLESASYFSRFDDDPELTREPGPRYENLMLMLEKDRVDVVIAPQMVGEHAMMESGIRASVSSFRVPGRASYLVVSRRSPLIEEAEQIRAVIAELEQQGKIASVVDRYRELQGIGQR